MEITTENKGKESLLNLLESLGLAYWVEITTAHPGEPYYFGPFVTAKEAEIYQGDYMQDLRDEGVEINAVNIKRCHPPILRTDPS
jgi:hypothetical protein